MEESGAADVIASMKLCPMCGEIGSYRCGSCSSVYYCCESHQKQHWKRHGRTCKKIKKLVAVEKPKKARNDEGWKKVCVVRHGSEDIRVEHLDRVALHYKIMCVNEQVLEDTCHGIPIKVKVGSCDNWLDKALEAMCLNEKARFAVVPSRSYNNLDALAHLGLGLDSPPVLVEVDVLEIIGLVIQEE